MDAQVIAGAGNVVRSASFAVIIILIVFFPILTLTGIEGKYFTPMAKTLVFCIIGALLLSLTYVPMMSSLFLSHHISSKPSFADRFFAWLNRIYQKCLAVCLRFNWATVGAAVAAFSASLMLFTRLGAEFIPTLDEGDFAMQMTLPAGSSLSRSINVSERAEKILMDNFPEIKHVVAKIGTAEVPTDPMAVEDADVMIVMKPFEEWTSASSRAELVEKMKASLDTIPDVEFNFSQPIQLRFNELMTGAKADIAIKLYGEDMAELYSKAKEAAKYVEQVPGASDVLVEQAMGLPQLVVNYNRAKIARYGINIEELNSIIRAAYVNMNIGRHFDVGEPLCEIVDKSNMMLRLTAYEKDLHNLKAGDSVVFRVNGIEGKTFRGAITMIGQQVNNENRSIDVYVRISEQNPQFRPGMYATARVELK